MKYLIYCSIVLSLIGYCLILLRSPLSFVCGLTSNALSIVYNAKAKRDTAQTLLFCVYSLLAVLGFILWTR